MRAILLNYDVTLFLLATLVVSSMLYFSNNAVRQAIGTQIKNVGSRLMKLKPMRFRPSYYPKLGSFWRGLAKIKGQVDLIGRISWQTEAETGFQKQHCVCVKFFISLLVQSFS